MDNVYYVLQKYNVLFEWEELDDIFKKNNFTEKQRDEMLKNCERITPEYCTQCGICSYCSLNNYGRDCENKLIPAREFKEIETISPFPYCQTIYYHLDEIKDLTKITLTLLKKDIKNGKLKGHLAQGEHLVAGQDLRIYLAKRDIF